MRAALGCLLWKEGVRAWRGCRRSLPPPLALSRPSQLVTSLRVCPGLGSGWARSWSCQLRVGTAGECARSLGSCCMPGLHTPVPPLHPFVHRRKPRPGGHGGGGSLAACAPSTLHRAWALHSATPGCAGRHALGGPGRGKGTFLPVCRRAQAGAGSSWPLPVAPHLFRGAIPAGVAPCWHRWSPDVALSRARSRRGC